MRRWGAVLGAVATLLSVSACGGSSAPAGAPASTSPSPPARLPAYVTARVRLGQQPCAVEGGFGSIWVSNYGDNLEVRLDPATRKVIARIKVGISPCGIAVGGGSVWVENYGGNSVSRIDPAHNTARTIAVGTAPYDVTYGYGAAWVTNYGDGTVSRIDARTGKVRTVKVGTSPTGVAPGAGAVWVTNGSDGTVSRIDPSTLAVHTRHIGTSTSWTSWGDGQVWISDGSQLEKVTLSGPRAGTPARRVRLGATLNDGDLVDGTVWVPDASGALRGVSARTGHVLGRWPLGLTNPFVLAGYAGKLWVVDFKGTDLEELDPAALR